MVSYFMPRGRFLIKAATLRHAQPQSKQQVQFQQGKWPMFRQFRQTFSTNNNTNNPAGNNATAAPAPRVPMRDALVQRSAHSLSKGRGKRDHPGTLQHQHPSQQQNRSAWMRWTGFLLRWAPVGILFYGAIEWQLHRQKCVRDEQPRTASNFQAKIYCSLPLRILSRCWGWLAACQVPPSLRPFVYGWYASAFDVNIEEALYPDYTHYPSLAEFFTRPLRDGARPIDATAPLVSPADGKVLHFGTATNSMIEQVKGVNYNIQTFLGPPTWRQRPSHHQLAANDSEFAEAVKECHDGSTTLYQCVIYLAPGDYHRFHSPAEWRPSVRRHFDGELLSVSPKVATWMPELFCLNERVLYVGQWAHGFFSYTAVGATNVGSVQIYMDEKLRTNRWVGLNVGAHKKRQPFDELTLAQHESNGSKGSGADPSDAFVFKRGDLVGQFNMGSTIVLLFEAPTNFRFAIEAGQAIRVGEPLGHFVANSS